ncbi:MAG: hypothetical protein NWS80_08635 [Akkermansiaceae bacterium]|nr:hypothetical protein [Akkermansiaceae bacterium]MDP4720097.1 hypothetical protein [Akkermansiaceae bacterium]
MTLTIFTYLPPTHIAMLGGKEMLVIVSIIFAIFVFVPLIFVILAIRKSKRNEEKDYVPYHLMEPEERLLMLQGLRAKELITDEDYDKKRKNILRELDGELETKDEEEKEEPSPPPVPEEKEP